MPWRPAVSPRSTGARLHRTPTQTRLDCSDVELRTVTTLPHKRRARTEQRVTWRSRPRSNLAVTSSAILWQTNPQAPRRAPEFGCGEREFAPHLMVSGGGPATRSGPEPNRPLALDPLPT